MPSDVTPKKARRRKSSLNGFTPRVGRTDRRTIRQTVVVFVVFALMVFLFSTRHSTISEFHLLRYIPSHRPPEQKNSTREDVHWYNDLKWLNPFSDSITFQVDRSVLPVLQQRTPIYTYYDAEQKEREEVRAAENRLLLIWRRAWWAKGFRPVVLGRAEATRNPLYESIQAKHLPSALEADILRWLAWGQMGSGVLANWLVLPMGKYDDPFMNRLRQGVYPELTRFEELGSGLFMGEKSAINGAITEALQSPNLKDPRTLYDAVKRNTFDVQARPSSIAFYDMNTMAEYYKEVSSKLTENKASGLAALAQLVTSHLHLTFLNIHSKGFAVLTPFAAKAQFLTYTAHSIANALRQCSAGNPAPSSCPPNHRKCTPCASLNAVQVTTPASYPSDSSSDGLVYSIGTVPNPYTFASLLSKTKDITTRHIRRDTGRDRWIGAITEKVLGTKLGGPSRLVTFKETVASIRGYSRSFWMIDDPTPSREDIEFHFGFEIHNLSFTTKSKEPSEVKKHTLEAVRYFVDLKGEFDDELEHEKDRRDTTGSKGATAAKGNAIKSEKAEPKWQVIPQEREKSLRFQSHLIHAGQKVVREARQQRLKAERKGKHWTKLKGDRPAAKEMVEAWNLADTEAWRFVRAFRMRERVERERWEADERKFAGGDPGFKGKWRWFDRP